jgi:hypothetical protein
MFETKNILNSYNFARNSDIVYSEIVTHEQFEKLEIKNYKIINQTDRLIFYKLTEIGLKENDLIFCNTDVVKNLFNLLRNVKNLKNLKLITNQTDTLIDKRLYNLKPDCINFWYSINVGHKSDDLIPIPLGLSNDYSPKNILVNDIDFKGVNEMADSILYLNFATNTNQKERSGIYKIYENQDWTVANSPDLNINNYQESLSRYRFTMCPWGNGIDTHRVWETLYLGNIPVTKEHFTFSNITDLPIFFVSKYGDIKLENLINFFNKVKNKNDLYKKLNINYWIKLMREIQVESNVSIRLAEHSIHTEFFVLKHKIKSKFFSRIKKIKYYLGKVKRILKYLK